MLLAAVTLTAVLQCAPVPGVDALWSDPNTRFVVVGEVHGTTEEPAFFSDVVCNASHDRGAVVVAVEQDTANQADIDAYMSSDGGPTARASFLKAGIWNESVKDGRSSKAYFALFESLRALHSAGRVARVVAFDASVPVQQGEDYNAVQNRAMAAAIQAVVKQEPIALVLVYTGNVHASIAPVDFGHGAFLPAAALLPRSQTVTIDLLDDGGEAWNCQTECGVHKFPARIHQERRVVLQNSGASAKPFVIRPLSFDGVGYTGRISTASYPAAQGNLAASSP